MQVMTRRDEPTRNHFMILAVLFQIANYVIKYDQGSRFQQIFYIFQAIYEYDVGFRCFQLMINLLKVFITEYYFFNRFTDDLCTSFNHVCYKECFPGTYERFELMKCSKYKIMNLMNFHLMGQKKQSNAAI